MVGAGGKLWTVTRVDASQLENALLNLCINARDAMAPKGGRLTIETANKWLDDRAAAERDLPPGQYISICVTDTGVGMTPEVIARAFDPFFTTKPAGRGTGLGLSMVYGFVRQSGGQVRVYSEVGRGTTMCLYLPRHVGESPDEAAPREAGADERADGETVLLIEDEETIRLLVTEEPGRPLATSVIPMLVTTGRPGCTRASAVEPARRSAAHRRRPARRPERSPGSRRRQRRGRH